MAAKRLHCLSRHTGWQLVYGLRPEFCGQDFRNQHDLGCLDAPTSIAGGALQVDDYTNLRYASERGVLREDGAQ